MSGLMSGGLGALVLSACAHPAATVPPEAPPAAWIDDPLLGATPQEVEALDSLSRGDPRARVVRLDRLLDLFDAARFGQDDDARETLWDALGGHATGVGERATREATERLLQEALALEAAALAETVSGSAADPEIAGFCADAIMLLSADLQPPAFAEDLSIRTLVYRTVIDQGHPRLADNARWRIYDHVRGTLAGAVEVPSGQRLSIAVQALYAERDSVEELLADTAPHARPPWPTADELWSLVDEQQRALATQPRWVPVLERRADDDHALHDTLRASLPASREADWPLRMLPAGTARAESLAPVVWVHQGRLVVDAGRSHARSLPLEVATNDELAELSQAVGNALAQDGRGTMLLVADPQLPAPQLRTVLRAIFRSHAERLELAVREPRVAADPSRGEGEVVMALPLHVTYAAGRRAGDRAWAQARVHVRLDGRGPSIAVDGRWLGRVPADARGLRALVEQIARAYPRERGVVVSLGSDVQLQQLLELLVALQGGPQRPFNAVGWMADGSHPSPREGGDDWLERRSALTWEHPGVELDQPYPLGVDDQKRLEAFGEDLAVCLPELGMQRAPPSVTLSLRFEEGRLRHAEVTSVSRRARAGAEAVVECIHDEGYALRLREHRETLALTVTLRAPAP